MRIKPINTVANITPKTTQSFFLNEPSLKSSNRLGSFTIAIFEYSGTKNLILCEEATPIDCGIG